MAADADASQPKPEPPEARVVPEPDADVVEPEQNGASPVSELPIEPATEPFEFCGQMLEPDTTYLACTQDIADVAALARLPRLRHVELSGALSDASGLAKLTSLEVLLLPWTKGRDYGFLPRLDKVSVLRLEGSTFRDSSLLLGMRNLGQVLLDEEDFESSAIRRLQRKRPKLAIVLL